MADASSKIGQVLAVNNGQFVNRETGEVETEYTDVSLISAARGEGAVHWSFEIVRMYRTEEQSKAGQWPASDDLVGRVCLIQGRTWNSGKDRTVRFFPQEGVPPMVLEGMKPFVDVRPEWKATKEPNKSAA